MEIADKIEINVDLNMTLAVDLFRRMNENLFNERINHGRGQLVRVPVLFRNRQKRGNLRGIHFVSLEFFRVRFQNGFQLCLLLFIACKEIVEPLFRNLVQRIRFVQLLNQHVEFVAALFRFSDFDFHRFCRFRVLQFGGFPHLARKLDLVGNRVTADRLNGFQNQRAKMLGGNAVRHALDVFPRAGKRI